MAMYKRKIILIILLLFFLPTILFAAETAADPNITLEVPLLSYTKATDIAEYIKNVYKGSLYIIIPFIIIMIIASGILWIIAGGDRQLIAKAKERIKYSLIGMAIVLFSYILLSFVGITVLQTPGMEEIPSEEPPILEGEFENESPYNIGSGPMLSAVPRIYQGSFRNIKWEGKDCTSTRTVSSGGCGLVASVMVLKYYGKNVSVAQAAQWTIDNGYRKCGVRGISFQGIAALAKWQGLPYRQIPRNFEAIKSSVINKKPVIILVHGPCKFTGNGHFIVLAGWDAAGNQFIVNDSGSHSAARTHGTWAEIAQECQLLGAGSMGG